jgi:hypothetical protein
MGLVCYARAAHYRRALQKHYKALKTLDSYLRQKSIPDVYTYGMF